LGPWRGYTPAVRGEAVQALLSRKDRILALLDAVQSRRVAIGDIPPTRRALLLRQTDPKIHGRAAALFEGETLSARKDVLAKYRAALRLPGDRQRGLQVFQRECSACHRLNGQGNDIGPSLNTIQHRSAEEVLTHVIDPNREVSPEFIEYLIVLKDGRTTTGVIAAETAAGLTLRRANDVRETILRQTIEEISSSGKSLMPEGLEQKVSVQEMADLLAVLVRLP
jgi:putative heme-binding domain-containing protein